MNYLNILGILFILLTVSPPTHAADAATPEILSGATIVDKNGLSELINQKGLLVDVRNPINFGRGHIPTAMSVPYKRVHTTGSDTELRSARWPIEKYLTSKETPVIIYSHGDTGWKSYEAALKLVELDYTKVYWFRGGMQEWNSYDGQIVVGR